MTIDDDLLMAAKRYALEHGTTVSDLARAALARTIGHKPVATDPLSAYSAGLLGRQEAMAALGVGYGDLLEGLASRGLPVPVLPDPEVRRMADNFLKIWSEAPDARRETDGRGGAS